MVFAYLEDSADPMRIDRAPAKRKLQAGPWKSDSNAVSEIGRRLVEAVQCVKVAK